MKPIYTCTIGGILERLKDCCQCLRTTARIADSQACLQTYENESEVPDPEQAKKEVEEFIYRDLFLWTILTNRIEMSKIILNQMKTRICAVLIASKIFKSYLHFASDNETKDVLRSQASQFEEYANEFLKSCYNYDEEKACEIAIRRLNIFGGVTCLQVISSNDFSLSNSHYLGCC